MIRKALCLCLICFSVVANEISHIAVASNMSHAANELIKAFLYKHPNTQIRPTLGSSGKLTAQIKNGANYSLFLSADMKYPLALHADAQTILPPQAYAYGKLALFSAQKRDLSKGIFALQNPNISKIALSNPRTAPYGTAGIEVLTKTKLLPKLKPKLVYAESIAQSLSYAQVATDFGLVALSLLHSPKMKKYTQGTHWVEINQTLYSPIKQGVALLKHAKNDENVQAFYEFLFTKEAQAIFRKYGYETP